MIVALGSLLREATGIIRSGEFSEVETPSESEIVAYSPDTLKTPAVVLSGTGADRSALAARWAIEYFSPEAIIVVGYCSATREHEYPGDIVIAGDVANLPGTPFEWDPSSMSDSIGPDRTLLRAARTAVETAGLDYHHGTVVTISQYTKTAGMKRWLGNPVGAVAVDTSLHPIAEVARAAGTPWISALSVLDIQDFDVPNTIDAEGTGPRDRELVTYAKRLTSSPLELPELLRLARASTKATSSLTTFMAAFMEAQSARVRIE
jgi:nucleoside phosphorylase